MLKLTLANHGNAHIQVAKSKLMLPGTEQVLASQDIYGATTNLLFTIFGSFGVKTVTADFSDLASLRES